MNYNSKLTYENKPYDHVGNVKVFPLSKQGLNEYFSGDHFTHKFLNKINLVNLRKNKHLENEQLIESKLFNTEGGDALKERVKDKSSRNSNFNNQDALSNANNQNIIFNSYHKNAAMIRKKSIINDIESNQNSPANRSKNNLYCKSDINSKITHNNLTNLINKTNTTNNNKITTTTKPVISKRQGSSSTIPRINQDSNKSTSNVLYCDKIKFSLETSSKFKKMENEEDLYDLCIKENEKMRSIIKSQTDLSFLKANNLPNITGGASIGQCQIIFNTNYKGNNKLIGGKYNPIYNYDVNQMQNRTKRNVFGSLFRN